MPGNANTRKIDEDENLNISDISTENTTGCILLLTPFHFVVILQHIYEPSQVISTCLYTDEFIVHR